MNEFNNVDPEADRRRIDNKRFDTTPPKFSRSWEAHLPMHAHGSIDPVAPDARRQDLTLRELQTNLPWTVHYSSDFRATPMAHKDMAHALLHIHKAGGMLAALVDKMDHRKETTDDRTLLDEHRKYVADMVVCALRIANTWPGGPIDLQREVEERLEGKNEVKLPRPR